ncbi:hypothetical protein AHF37_10983 [Paragonimus kellicotti]|nr:hypothetical protein AHF37_10983 [Paragonimus kellicotti]
MGKDLCYPSLKEQFLNVIAEEQENSSCAPSRRSDSSRSDKLASQSSGRRV